MEFCFLQSLRLASQATSLYTREAFLPPDSTPKRCNKLYLARKACEKEYGQNCPYSFYCRTGVYLPPFYLHISFVFGGSKPPPYLLYGRCPVPCSFLFSSAFLADSDLSCLFFAFALTRIFSGKIEVSCYVNDIEDEAQDLTDETDIGKQDGVIDDPKCRDDDAGSLDGDLGIPPERHNEKRIANDGNDRKRRFKGENTENDKGNDKERRDPESRKETVLALEIKDQHHQNADKTASTPRCSFGPHQKIVDGLQEIYHHIANKNSAPTDLKYRVGKKNENRKGH